MDEGVLTYEKIPSEMIETAFVVRYQSTLQKINRLLEGLEFECDELICLENCITRYKILILVCAVYRCPLLQILSGKTYRKSF